MNDMDTGLVLLGIALVGLPLALGGYIVGTRYGGRIADWAVRKLRGW